ncbi:dTDP-4-dehydrorhamnose reductase [candidate division WS5 bacterium]|uniref:dTDP-4-dehydrorhamnose reductase n=1 Tax=candidate division WS5 bacterium TaxID=2093353 RepID=A0A419DGM4_9BACT|nr:MAG: dTDP-4-dehydrorhamnose reductase [candidate division WS5 bacterium]
MTKILVTGGYGQLGTALKEVLKSEEALLTDTDTMDITDASQVEKAFEGFKPEWLVHGAALTNVDGCEENPELAQSINSFGTEILAKACENYHCKMIYISTDYVFDGKKKEPYFETDTPNPQSVYGKTKLEGEKKIQENSGGYILRTSWVYGEGNNFVRTMLRLSEKMEKIKVVNDQFGRPTYASDLARAIYDVIKKQPPACRPREDGDPENSVGIYNVTGDGSVISWADFASEIFKIAGKKTIVIPISTGEYFKDNKDKKIAPRPAYSVLDLTKAKKAGLFLTTWQESLKKYL